MKLGVVVISSFLLSFALVIIGTLLKLNHSEDANEILLAGIICSVIFIATSVYEVRTSKKKNPTDKSLWTFALIFFPTVAGIIYILVGRKEVV